MTTHTIRSKIDGHAAIEFLPSIEGDKVLLALTTYDKGQETAIAMTKADVIGLIDFLRGQYPLMEDL